MAERKKVPLRRLLRLAIPQLRLLGLATIALLLAAGMNLAFPLVVKYIVDLVDKGLDRTLLNQAALGLVVLFMFQAVFSMARVYLFTLAGERIVATLRTRVFEAILGQEVAFFDETRVGELTNRLGSDTTVLQNTVTVNVSMALRFGVGVVGGIGMLFWMSPLLTVVALAVVPVVTIGASMYGRVIRKLSSKVQDALARSTEIAEEGISGVRTVRAFAMEEAETGRYKEAVEDSYRLAVKRAMAYGIFQGVAGFGGYSAIALVVWFGGGMVLDGALTLGDLTAFLLYTLNVAVSFGALAGLWGDFMRAAGASERIFEILDRDRGLESADGTHTVSEVGKVSLSNVEFSYPTRPDVPVLSDFSLSIAPGEVVALVGPSGAGKSTIAQLLLRFYDPQRGRIEVGGRPLETFDLKAWRRAIGIVSQEPILFAASIEENIRYGRPTASFEQVKAAATAANALSFIEEFPEGFDTEVGERGVRLSGGQKQRIAIARAILKDPGLLILDEATSALDAENEHLVQEALERLMEGRTTVVIAHRLSTIQGADRVVVLEQGRVLEEGSHQVLLAQDGLYKRLVERQFAQADEVRERVAGEPLVAEEG